MSVRRFRNIAFALAAFLWLPVSLHCKLESVPGFDFLRCGDNFASSSHNTNKDCSDCCKVEKSQYQTEQLRATDPTIDFISFTDFAVAPSLKSLPVEVSLGILTAAPPEFPKSWQFFSRTALPVRAPSVAS